MCLQIVTLSSQSLVHCRVSLSTDLYICGVARGSHEVVAGSKLREALTASRGLSMPHGLKVMGFRTPQLLREGTVLQVT